MRNKDFIFNKHQIQRINYLSYFYCYDIIMDKIFRYKFLRKNIINADTLLYYKIEVFYRINLVL